MIIKKECVAMLLAGGQGSRLYVLTEKNAKPAVTFGENTGSLIFPSPTACIRALIRWES